MNREICHDQRCNDERHFHPSVRCRNGFNCKQGYNCQFRHDEFMEDFRRPKKRLLSPRYSFKNTKRDNYHNSRVPVQKQSSPDLASMIFQLINEQQDNTRELRRLVKKVKNLEKQIEDLNKDGEVIVRG